MSWVNLKLLFQSVFKNIYPDISYSNPKFVIGMAKLIQDISENIHYKGYENDLTQLWKNQNEFFNYLIFFSFPRKLKAESKVLNDIIEGNKSTGKNPIQESVERILIGSAWMWKRLCENKDKIIWAQNFLPLQKDNSIYVDQNNTPESLFDFRKAGLGMGFYELLQIRNPEVFIANLFPEIIEPEIANIRITRPIIGELITIAAVAQMVDPRVRFVAR